MPCAKLKTYMETGRVVFLPARSIRPNPAQPRRTFDEEALTELTLNGKQVTYLPVDANRCDWATKFSLVCEEGNMFTGNFTDVPCPDKITAENLDAALRTMDPVLKFRPVTGEKCIISCPLLK